MNNIMRGESTSADRESAQISRIKLALFDAEQDSKYAKRRHNAIEYRAPNRKLYRVTVQELRG